MSELTPRIYVACLAAYNSGQLHGTWIDANQGADAIHEEILAMLATERAAALSMGIPTVGAR